MLFYFEICKKLRNMAGVQPRVVGTRGSGREGITNTVLVYT